MEHAPKFEYDCEHCKFNWCCGLACVCVVGDKMNLPEPPIERKKEVNEALKKCGYAIEFLPNGKRARGR